MDNNQNNNEPTKEELELEEQGLKDSKENEVRASIIEKYGLDETENAELIDKLTKDTLETKKSFSTVIKQKRSWRDKAIGNNKDDKNKDDKKGTFDPEEFKKQAKAEVEESFAQRDLEELDLPEDIKTEVKVIAKAKNISIRKASQDPYIVFLTDKHKEQEKIDNATITRTRKGNKVAIDTTKPLNPADFDMTTPEGRKEWDDAKKAKKAK